MNPVADECGEKYMTLIYNSIMKMSLSFEFREMKKQRIRRSTHPLMAKQVF